MLTGGQAPQYCHEFKPECASNEVIVMRTAHFGRMRRGECIGKHEILYNYQLMR